MSKPQSETENIMIYMGLISALIDQIEFDLYRSRFKDNFLNYKLKDIQNELIKKERLVFTRDNSHSDSVHKQYRDAGTIMLKMYRIGLLISEMDDIRAVGFDAQLDSLLVSYGIETDL
jgi:hypothetical protein